MRIENWLWHGWEAEDSAVANDGDRELCCVV
jgi:hypothetical protein